MKSNKSVWIFNGDKGRFCSAVFSNYEKAVDWIKQIGATGMLTCYPVDSSVYDWSIAKDYFRPSKELHNTAGFIANFSSASLEHTRFENGEER
ncbi:MAG: hypothetical protein ACI8WB_002356 [Phenylobacterium sp.]|jgi:hypothetical protein